MNKITIPFNIPTVLGTEQDYIADAIGKRRLCGGNTYTKACAGLLEERYHAQKALLTSSCTAALEMSAMLCRIQPGDEVIMPSFTFVSTANAFALLGAKLVFVDIRPDTQNLDERLIEAAITEKTKAIVPVHYAGVGCEMDRILALAKKYSLMVVEDAAQGVNAFYKDKALGTLGDFGTYSFHETKNYTMGEGGALLIRSPEDNLRSEIIWEKGTNRSEFLLGMVDKYSWVALGSSNLPSELSASYLYGQLRSAQEIHDRRMARYQQYYDLLKPLEEAGKMELPFVPEYCSHNAHMFYIKTRSLEERTKLMEYLKERGISSAFHYVPLHSSPQGLQCGRFSGEDRYTTDTSSRLLRLPMYTELTELEVEYVCDKISAFYREGSYEKTNYKAITSAAS